MDVVKKQINPDQQADQQADQQINQQADQQINQQSDQQIVTQNIVSWIQYDNKIKEYNEKCKKLREERDKVGESMVKTITDKENLPTYNVTTLNASVSFQNTKTYENYTNKFYTECFAEFLGSEEKAKELIDFMKNKRKVESKMSLKRGYIMEM